MLTYLLCYAIARGVLELWRGDAGRGWFLEGVLGRTLSTSQGLSMMVAVSALAVATQANASQILLSNATSDPAVAATASHTSA